MKFFLKKSVVLGSSAIGITLLFIACFLSIQFGRYISLSDRISLTGKTELENKLDEYMNDSYINEATNKVSELSGKLIMQGGNAASPESIQETKVKTEVLSKDKDLDYNSYDSEFLGKKRVITYINLLSVEDSIYKILYPNVDCLGKTFSGTFEGDKPKSKKECESEVIKIHKKDAENQRNTIAKIKEINDFIAGKIKPLKDEVIANGGAVKIWMPGPSIDTCSEHTAMASEDIPEAYKTKNECISAINKKIKDIDEENARNEGVISFFPFIVILVVILLMPAALKISSLIIKAALNLWLVFLEKSSESINKSEKKIKIDAKIEMREKKIKSKFVGVRN